MHHAVQGTDLGVVSWLMT